MFKKFGRKSFGAIQKAMLYISNKTESHEKLANFDARFSKQPYEVKYIKPVERKVKLTRLANGVRVMSETPAIPSLVTLGIMLEVGSQNETPETSGSLFSIQATQYKSSLNTNETINYGMVQMSGGNYEMEFDRERTIFKATCLSHDVSDIFSMMSDCALEPRTSVAVNASMMRMKHMHKVYNAKYPGKEETDFLLAEIYGHEGLGMPLNGAEKNIDYLTAYLVQKFQIENYSPEKMIVAGLGVENHGEFVNLVEEYFGNLSYSSKLRTLNKLTFKEVELRTLDHTSYKNNICLVFESVPSSHPDFIKATLARELFGWADISNPNCHQANSGLFVKELYNKEKVLHSIEMFNIHFDNVGLVGIRLSTGGESSNKVIDALVKLIKSIDNMTDADLMGAKKRLLRKIHEAGECNNLRINDVLKQQSIFGEVKTDQLLRDVESATAKDIVGFIKQTFKGKASIYIKGSHPSSVYSLTKIKDLLK